MTKRAGRLLRFMLFVQRLNPPGLGGLQVLNAWTVSLIWRLRGFRPPEFRLQGRVEGDRPYLIRRLGRSDRQRLQVLLAGLSPEERLFVPHRCGSLMVRLVLSSRGFYPLGLFLDDDESRLAGYGLCRPTVRGLTLFAVILAPGALGLGLGATLTGAWVDLAVQLEQKPFSLVYADNAASLACLRKTRLQLTPLNDQLLICTLPDESEEPGERP